MALAISSWPLPMEARVHVVDEVTLGHVLSEFFSFVNIFPLWLSILIYLQGDEQ
jgi:hypothetical protein